jgi:hypothetical protein
MTSAPATSAQEAPLLEREAALELLARANSTTPSADEADSSSSRARRREDGAAAFAFWHPDFVTLHLWVWYPNSDGIYSGANPLVRPFKKG